MSWTLCRNFLKTYVTYSLRSSSNSPNILTHPFLTAAARQNVSKRKYHSQTLFVTPCQIGKDDDVNRHAHPNLTTIDIMDIFANEIVGQQKEYTPSGVCETLKGRSELMELLPKSVDELPPRRMKDSFVTAVIPLKDRADIRERYVTFDGKVRIGRILEDMDIFSVYCVFRHILNPRSQGKRNPYSVVTALVDSIHVSDERMKNDEDIRLSGHVSYAGKSSIEVSLVVDQISAEDGKYHKILDAIFLMVARNPLNSGAAFINPLMAETEEEQKFLNKGAERQAVRKAQEMESLAKKPPNEEERHFIHNMFIEHLDPSHSHVMCSSRKSSPSDLLSNNVRMDDTALKTVFICHPQYRNRYNKIFGGFIMRQALELAFTNSFLYAKHRPRLVNIDDISFKRPVEIGSILRYTSHVGYVEGNFIHCPVRAEVIAPNTGESKVTNVFQFTFHVDEKTAEIPSLSFNTYREAMVYLESRRHFKKMMTEFLPMTE